MHRKEGVDEKVVTKGNLLTKLDQGYFYAYVLFWVRPHFFNDLMYRHRRKIGPTLRLRKHMLCSVHALTSTILALRLTSGSYFPEVAVIKGHWWLMAFYLIAAYVTLRWVLPATPAVYGEVERPTPVPRYQNPFERAYNEVYEKGRREGYSDGYSTGLSAGSCMRWR